MGRGDRSRSNRNEVNKCRDDDVDSHVVVLILHGSDYVDFVGSKLRGNAVSHYSRNAEWPACFNNFLRSFKLQPTQRLRPWNFGKNLTKSEKINSKRKKRAAINFNDTCASADFESMQMECRWNMQMSLTQEIYTRRKVDVLKCFYPSCRRCGLEIGWSLHSKGTIGNSPSRFVWGVPGRSTRRCPCLCHSCWDRNG